LTNRNHLEVYVGDLLNNFRFDEALEGVDLVIHLFWSNLPRNKRSFLREDLANSVGVGIALLEACVRSGVRKFIFPSSGGTVYGIPEEIPIKEDHAEIPISSYGLTKIVFEKYLHLFSSWHDLDFTILRLSNVYGPKQNLEVSQGVVSHWIKSILKAGRIELWGDGSIVRDYIYIEDAVSAFIPCLKITTSNTYNISSNEGHSLTTIIKILSEDLDLAFEIERKKGDRTDVPTNILDNSLARLELDWEPICPLPDGIMKTYEFLRAIY